MTDSVTLWGDIRFCSPWVLSVWAALKEKDIPFRMKTVDYRKGDHLSPDFLTKNPLGKIPVLEHDGFFLGESSAILEYLEDVFDGDPIFPQEPEGQAEDRMILSWLRSDLADLRQSFPFEGLFIPGVERATPGPEAEEQARDLIGVVTHRIARSSLEKRAQKPTIADLELASTLRRLIHYKYLVPDFPEVIEYSDAIWQRPSIQSWVKHERVLFL